jgi:hypothetical protein
MQVFSKQSHRALTQYLGVKKSAYAASNILIYWVVDGIKRGVWVFTEPVAGIYESEIFFESDAEIDLPVLGRTLYLASIFPPYS